MGQGGEFFHSISMEENNDVATVLSGVEIGYKPRVTSSLTVQ